MTYIEQAISKVMRVIPKRDTIMSICSMLKEVFHGIKENVLRLYENVMFARLFRGVSFDTEKQGITYATGTTTTLRSMDVSLVIEKLKSDLKLLDLNGLVNELGITKEGAQRLIWLLDDVRDTNNGSEKFSEEMTTRVKNALYVERILKQTTIQSGLRPSLTKNELPPTKEHWRVNDYGIQKMGAHSVVNATAI